MFYDPVGRFEPEVEDHQPVRLQALAEAKRWWETRPLYLDTETTGLGDQAEVLEIGIVDHDGRVLLDQLIKPIGKISEGAREVHGITEEMLACAPRWGEVHDQIYSILKDRAIVIYNYAFDTRIIDQTVSYHWFIKDWIDWPPPRCAMKLYARFQGSWNDYYGNYAWHKLTAAASQLGIEVENSHRAVDDARVTRKLIKKLAQLHENPDKEIKQGIKIKKGWLPG
ncbi:MAG: exonuclease domain-containing protein [bacterium]